MTVIDFTKARTTPRPVLVSRAPAPVVPIKPKTFPQTVLLLVAIIEEIDEEALGLVDNTTRAIVAEAKALARSELSRGPQRPLPREGGGGDAANPASPVHHIPREENSCPCDVEPA